MIKIFINGNKILKIYNNIIKNTIKLMYIINKLNLNKKGIKSN